jgi:UDP-3-O-[3-hydroxymyristoyl] glucosamine N-acyltransferase
MNHSATSTSYSVGELASLVVGRVVGNSDAPVTGINRIDAAQAGEATFLSTDKYSKFLAITRATCVITTAELAGNAPSRLTLIIVPDAYRAFVQVMQRFYPPFMMKSGMRHPAAVIEEGAQVHSSASVGPGCVINEGCIVGPNVQLFANVVLYRDVSVDADTIIHANVSVGQGTQIGKRCIIHAGAVIGADGFGFLENSDGSFEKIPQVGIVFIGDDVEVGSNTTIDRAAVGATSISSGVKLDNLIHIAHGVSIGEDTAIAAQAGVSGSTTLGKRNRIAGQVGLIGHIQTADDVIVEAQSGVSKSITLPGHYFGSPAKEHRTALRMEAALRRLPDLLNEFRELQKIVAELTETK